MENNNNLDSNNNNNKTNDIKNEILSEIKDTLIDDLKSQLFSFVDKTTNNNSNNNNNNNNNSCFNNNENNSDSSIGFEILSEQLLKLHQKQIELLNEKYSSVVDSKFKEIESKLINRIDEKLVEIDVETVQSPNTPVNAFSALGSSLSKLKRKLIVNNDSDRETLNKKLKIMIEKEFKMEIKNKDDDLIEIDTRILKVKEMLSSLGRFRTSERYHKSNNLITATTPSTTTSQSNNNSNNIATATTTTTTKQSPTKVYCQARENQFYQLLCSRCGKETVSPVGFASHCRLVHLLKFKNTEEAVIEYALPVDSSVVPLDDPSRLNWKPSKELSDIAGTNTPPSMTILSTTPTPTSSTLSSLTSSPIFTPSELSSLTVSPLLQSLSGSINNNENEEESSRFYVRKRIVVGNTSMQIHPSHIGADKSTHKWMVYVRGADSEHDISYYINKIWFYLHDSFAPNNIVELTDPPFQVSRRGWGEFPIRVKLFFNDTRNKPISFIHQLKLIQTPIQYGVRSLGSESAFDLDLDRHFFDKRDREMKKQQQEALAQLEKEKERQEQKKLKKEQKHKDLIANLDNITINSEQIQDILIKYSNKYKLIADNNNNMNNNNQNSGNNNNNSNNNNNINDDNNDSLPITSSSPYRIAKSKEKWLKWTFGKQISSEFKRSKLIRNKIKESIGKEFRIKDIMRWCRINNKTPMTQIQENLLKEILENDEKEQEKERLEKERLEKDPLGSTDVAMKPIDSESDSATGTKKEMISESESETTTTTKRPTKKKSKYQSKKEREMALKATLPAMDIMIEPDPEPLPIQQDQQHDQQSQLHDIQQQQQQQQDMQQPMQQDQQSQQHDMIPPPLQQQQQQEIQQPQEIQQTLQQLSKIPEIENNNNNIEQPIIQHQEHQQEQQVQQQQEIQQHQEPLQEQHQEQHQEHHISSQLHQQPPTPQHHDIQQHQAMDHHEPPPFECNDQDMHDIKEEPVYTKSEIIYAQPIQSPLTPSTSASLHHHQHIKNEMPSMIDDIFPVINTSHIVEQASLHQQQQQQLQQYRPQQQYYGQPTSHAPLTPTPPKPAQQVPHIQMFPLNLASLFSPTSTPITNPIVSKVNQSNTGKKTLGPFPLFFCKYCGTGHQPDTFEQKQRACAQNFKGSTYTSLVKSFPKIKITYPVNFDSDSKQPNPNAKSSLAMLSEMRLPILGGGSYQIDWIQNILKLIGIQRSRDPLVNDFKAEELIYLSSILFMKSIISETLQVYQSDREKEPKEECIIKLIVPTHLHTVIKSNPLLNFISNTALYRDK